MTKFLSFSTVFLTLGLCVAGCGGSGGTDFVGNFADNGIYAVAYNRAGGNITVTVSKEGIVTITIVDDAAGTYTGSGRINSAEAFSVPVTNAKNGDSLLVDGSLNKSALSKKFIGKVRGSITFNYTAPLAVGNVTVTLFAGSYGGNLDFRDFSSSDCSAVVDANGFVNAQFFANNKTVNLSGLVYSDGRVIMSPAEGEKQKYYAKGVCYMFADLQNLFMKAEVSTTKDGKSIGTFRAQTPYSPN